MPCRADHPGARSRRRRPHDGPVEIGERGRQVRKQAESPLVFGHAPDALVGRLGAVAQLAPRRQEVQAGAHRPEFGEGEDHGEPFPVRGVDGLGGEEIAADEVNEIEASGLQDGAQRLANRRVVVTVVEEPSSASGIERDAVDGIRSALPVRRAFTLEARFIHALDGEHFHVVAVGRKPVGHALGSALCARRSEGGNPCAAIRIRNRTSSVCTERHGPGMTAARRPLLAGSDAVASRPYAQDGQAPELARCAGPARLHFLPQSIHGVTREERRARQDAVGDQVEDQFPQAAGQPPIGRDVERPLGAGDDCRRKEFRRHLPQQEFRNALLHLQGRGDPGNELDHVMIQEWTPGFN